jgi:dienelactone hydrolase
VNDAQRLLLGYDRGLPLDAHLEEHAAGETPGLVRFTYLSAGLIRVPALLARPPDGNRGPAILLQHGGGESKDDPLIRLLLRRWSGAGYTCLAIDAPGHGDRAPPVGAGPRRSFHEYLRARIHNVIDLRRGIDYLVSDKAIDPDRIGFWGVSMGGGVGVMLIAADERVRAACLCVTGARSRRSWPETDPGVAEFVARNLDPVALAPLLAGREVLMLNGEDDETISKEDTLRLFEALAGPKELRWFRSGHKVTAAMLRASKEFFDRTLG